MKRLHTNLVFLFFLFSISSTFGQDFLIKGKIVDAVTGNPLEAATIYAETLRDSTLITYTITNAQGAFALEGKTAYKRARIAFSSNGYKSHTMEVELKPTIELPTIQMNEQVQQLDGIDLVGERVPITIKKDTLEFNSDSFKTRPDATVEDVLKKLPGVEVASDGTITVNGKEVNQVLVNGQVFFSTDPKVATKSLSKDVISKIQITDTKTKEQEFTGQEGDGETKTINLMLKEDKNKGFMGRLSGGYGTDDRYQANGLLNYFNDTKRISVLGSSNNINNPGFSFDEIYEMVGNSRGGGVRFNRNGGFSIGDASFGFGQGITTSSTLGASFADQEKGKYRIDGNYFYSYSDSYNDEKIARENILPDGSYFTDTETNFLGTTNSNQGALNLEFDVDKTTRITVQPNISVTNTNSTNAENTVSTDEDGNLINSNTSLTTSDGNQRNFSNRLEVMKKLDTLGTYIRAYFNNNNRANDSEGYVNSQRSIFGDNPSEQDLDQRTLIDNSNDSYELGAAYRHFFNKQFYLDVRYEYENTKQQNERSVSVFDEDLGQYVYNSTLSSDFNFTVDKHAPEIRIGSNGKKLRFNVRARLENNSLNNEDFVQSTTFSNAYNNVLFGSFINYQMGNSKRLSLNYNSNLNVPSVTQLQPVPNISNPLNIIVGNPNLAPEISHNIYLNFNNFNWKDRTGIFAYSGMNIEEDQVVSITTTDEDFIRTTTYQNVKGNYRGWMGVNYSKQIKKDSVYTLKFTISPNVNASKQVGFTNGSRLEAKTWNFNPRVGLLFNYKEMLEIEPEYRIGFNSTRYNLESVEDVDFTTHNVSFKMTTFWPQNLVFGNDITYSYNGNLGDGFDKDAIFWNMSLGLQLFNKKATLKVLAYDLLNQNINTRRTTGQDFIQDFQGTALKRYFMGSLTIKFDSFGGKGAPNQRGGGPRFMRF
ncbi:outer membrane beta-barrel protein [Flagellimonas zhangzhouensis]|uniref:CarboxypepD_reg-like domain-containing protein n=1 Tax=Flagellimonas zhangzhouensis TaxID=1073328 RepID=A0A1H2VV58_9FLAO|nr:outer membrane beta-barrel protein [Allomuricauda zhangzhouensis]SDQ05476.1 Carboxypeptidase regulatory-like domain-containing protein [Allomuricauda zhangzhouensis]SDW72111.1 CarboxypepD_reg-like domain-containing protein [Allomuricauda zhangzhouensis]